MNIQNNDDFSKMYDFEVALDKDKLIPFFTDENDPNVLHVELNQEVHKFSTLLQDSIIVIKKDDSKELTIKAFIWGDESSSDVSGTFLRWVGTLIGMDVDAFPGDVSEKVDFVELP